MINEMMCGMRFIEISPVVETDIPLRIHKQKRLQKKWLKRYGYKKTITPIDKMYQMGNTIIGHPVAIALIKKQLLKNNYCNKTNL